MLLQVRAIKILGCKHPVMWLGAYAQSMHGTKADDVLGNVDRQGVLKIVLERALQDQTDAQAGHHAVYFN